MPTVQHGDPGPGHFDGTHFHNPGGDQARNLITVLTWFLTRRKAQWPRWIENTAHPPPSLPGPEDIAVTWIGHATFLLRLRAAEGRVVTVLTDPLFSLRASPFSFVGPRRVRAPGIELDALPQVDIVLVSHNHYDHMDMASLRALQARWKPSVITTLGNARPLARAGIMGATELDWWDSVEIGGLMVTATPARHFSRRGMFDANRTLWSGFMLQGSDHRLYYAGDTGYGPQFRAIRDRLGAPALALLPIGAYLPRSLMAPVHLEPAEAVRAFGDLGAARAIGMHWGTVQLTDEAIDDPPRRLAEARAEAGLLRGVFDVLDVGETRHFPLLHDISALPLDAAALNRRLDRSLDVPTISDQGG